MSGWEVKGIVTPTPGGVGLVGPGKFAVALRDNKGGDARALCDIFLAHRSAVAADPYATLRPVALDVEPPDGATEGATQGAAGATQGAAVAPSPPAADTSQDAERPVPGVPVATVGMLTAAAAPVVAAVDSRPGVALIDPAQPMRAILAHPGEPSERNR